LATLITKAMKACMKLKNVKKVWIETTVNPKTMAMKMYACVKIHFKGEEKEKILAIERNDMVSAFAELHMVITEKSKSKIISLLDNMKENLKM